MDIRRLTPDFAAAPQITPEDCATLAAEGFRVLINNRPDMENPAELQSAAMQAAAEAAGLVYIENPVVSTAMTMEMVTTQAAAIAAAEGPVLAYCRSGTRSTIIWALSQAGILPTETLIEAAASGGYDLSPVLGQIEALAAQRR